MNERTNVLENVDKKRVNPEEHQRSAVEGEQQYRGRGQLQVGAVSKREHIENDNFQPQHDVEEDEAQQQPNWVSLSKRN